MTRRPIVRALGAAAILLGCAHLAIAALSFRAWTLDALWFVGTGLAIIAAANLNLMADGPLSPQQRALLFASNLAMTAFFLAAWFALPGPQVIAGAAIFAALTFCSAMRQTAAV